MKAVVYLLEHNVAFPKRESQFKFGLPFGEIKDQTIFDSKIFYDLAWNVVERNVANINYSGIKWLHDDYISSPTYQAIRFIYKQDAMCHHAVDLRSEVNKTYYY